MNNKIRIAIVGYGNVGRGVKYAIENSKDMELSLILSRSPDRVKSKIPGIRVEHIDNTDSLKDCDVAILCGGSKNDLPEQGPKFAALINTVDSYDNHSCIPQYFAEMDGVAKKSGKVSVISTGWDPGTFSLERVLDNAFIPGAKTYGFYGVSEKGGLSMGHSDALRTIKGVKDARQYTHAIPEAIERVRNGENPELTPGEMHWRECFVVLEDGADKAKIEDEIKNMPGYFAPYKTTVNFITKEELDKSYSGFPHDGLVIGSGKTGAGNSAVIEYKNVWGSNPEATANILTAHARAAYKLSLDKKSGVFTILDIPPAYFSTYTREELIEKFM